MNFSGQKLKRIGWRMIQLAILSAVFIVGGVLLPVRYAPAVFDYLPYTTPQEQQAKQWSVQISNRNADSGEEFLVAARNPAGTVRIADINYSCDISDIELVYETDEGNKQLPCGTKVILPNESDHRLRVYTDRTDVGYLPVTLSVTNGENERDISLVLAASRVGTNEKSRVDDQAVVTFDSLE